MNLFDVFKNFRRGDPILSADFNALQNSLVSSFRKLGTEREDSTTGVEEPFSVGTPVAPANAATKDYVDAAITTVEPKPGIKGDKGDQGEQGDSLEIKGVVSSYANLPGSASQGDIWFTTDTAKLWLWDDSPIDGSPGLWVDLGEVQGPQGPAGTNGTDGTDGTNGSKGDVGDEGDRGPKGNTGDQGPRGDRGYSGDQGPAGASYTGPAIERGAVGEILVWSTANTQYVATDSFELVGGAWQFKQLAPGGNTLVMASSTGVLYPYTAARLLNLDDDLEGIEETIKELQARINRLEIK